MSGKCTICGGKTHKDDRALYCWGCAKNGDKARSAVFQAVKKGLLPRPTEYACTDCGDGATQYEHRDYNKPLDVQPVCRRCNWKRGAAIPDLKYTKAATKGKK